MTDAARTPCSHLWKDGWCSACGIGYATWATEKIATLTAGVERLMKALNVMVIITKQGQPCYRSTNGLPMGMPRRVERTVRAALEHPRCPECRVGPATGNVKVPARILRDP